MPKIRSLTMTAPQVRAIMREIEAPGTGMSRVSVPWDPQPKSRPFQIKGDKSGDWYTENPNYPRRGSMLNGRWRCPYAPGDMIAVRETFAIEDTFNYHGSHFLPTDGRPIERFDSAEGGWCFIPHYRATEPEPNLVNCGQAIENWDGRTRWVPSVRMPHKWSRLTLIVTDVQARRVQSIAEAEAMAMGVPQLAGSYRCSLSREWEHRYDKRSFWDSNPWVWFLFFRPIARNVDDVVAEMGDA